MAQPIKIFSKLLTDTDINKRLAIPATILPSLPDFNGSHAVTIPLMYGTRMWQIICTIRKTGHQKPVFSRGWRKFVVCNNFDVGDELTLFKVQDEADSFHYRVQVEKPARPSGGLFPPFSLNHEVDETTGTSRTKACNFQNEQQQLLKADASIKQEEAITELADVAFDAPPVPFVDHVIAKPASRISGSDVTHVSAEATSKAHFKTEEESKMKFFGITKSIYMGEPLLRSYDMTNEERETNFFALAEDVAMAYGTNQAVGDAYHKGHTERLNLDLTLGLSTPYAGEIMNLDLTLAPHIDGGHEIKESWNSSPKQSY